MQVVWGLCGLGASGLGVCDLGASGLGTSGLGASGLGASGLEASGLGVCGLGVCGLGACGLIVLLEMVACYRTTWSDHERVEEFGSSSEGTGGVVSCSHILFRLWNKV